MDNLQRLGIIFCILSLWVLTNIPVTYANDQFIINQSESKLDHRYQYTYDLLQLVIDARATA